VGSACGTHERGQKSLQGFGAKAQRKEDIHGRMRVDLGEVGWGVWSEFKRLRIGAGEGLL
jgi:hypothetical protein